MFDQANMINGITIGAGFFFWCLLGIAVIRWHTRAGDVIMMIYHNYPTGTTIALVVMALLWPLATVLFWLWYSYEWLQDWSYRRKEQRADAYHAGQIEGTDGFYAIGRDHYLLYNAEGLKKAMRSARYLRLSDDEPRITQAEVPTNIKYPCLATIVHAKGTVALQVSTMQLDELREILRKYP